MTWTPVDLATIAGILDTLSVDPHAGDAPDRLLDMINVHPAPDPDTPSVDANAVRVLAGMLRMGVSVGNSAVRLTACLQYPLPDPTHGG